MSPLADVNWGAFPEYNHVNSELKLYALNWRWRSDIAVTASYICHVVECRPIVTSYLWIL